MPHARFLLKLLISRGNGIGPRAKVGAPEQHSVAVHCGPHAGLCFFGAALVQIDLQAELLVAVDGTGYFYSESIHCDRCSVAHHRDGRVTYSHTALMPAVVEPDTAQVIPLEPEFITPQDGHKKQDCESVAAMVHSGHELRAMAIHHRNP